MAMNAIERQVDTVLRNRSLLERHQQSGEPLGNTTSKRYHVYTDDVLKVAAAMRERGMSWREIGAELGVSYGGIRVSVHKWKQRTSCGQ